MVTIAVDTSQPVGSVALARDDVLLGLERFHAPSSHLVALGRAVEVLLSGHGLTPAAVDRLAIVIGPGSFTGLRIGLSFVKGFHAARGAAVVTIDSLRLLALPHLGAHARVCTMLDARRGEVYAAVYERAGDAERAANPAAARELVPPCAREPGALLDSLPAAPDAFAGTGSIAHRSLVAARFPFAAILDDDEGLPPVSYLAVIAHRLSALDHAGVRALEPTYVRPSGAERVRLRAHGRRANGGDGGSGERP